MNSKPLIAVVVPYRERFEPAFWMDNWLPLYENRMSLDWCTIAIGKGLMNDMPHVSAARNSLVIPALHRGADFLYWLDADTVPRSPRSSVEALKTLYEVCRDDGFDIVSGLHLAKNTRKPCAYRWAEEHYRPVSLEEIGSNVYGVDAVGMGCVLMKAEIFGRVQPPWFKCDDQYQDYGEDVGFCRRAKEEGFGIFVHPRAVFNHIGLFQLTIEGDLLRPI